MPLRVHAALDAWRAATRARDALPEGSPEWKTASEDVRVAREAYLAVVREVAETKGPDAMADLTETQMVDLRRTEG